MNLYKLYPQCVLLVSQVALEWYVCVCVLAPVNISIRACVGVPLCPPSARGRLSPDEISGGGASGISDTTPSGWRTGSERCCRHCA